MIKAVLALEKAVIPAIAMFEKPNPAIDVASLKLEVRPNPEHNTIALMCRFNSLRADTSLVPQSTNSVAISRGTKGIRKLFRIRRKQCPRHLGRCIQLFAHP